jgi:hypothetical protein
VLVLPGPLDLNAHPISGPSGLRPGYLALACDLQGEGLAVDHLPEATALSQPLFNERPRPSQRALLALGAGPEIDAERIARDAEAEWQLHLYSRTVHSFTNPEAAQRNMSETIRYSPDADARAWASALDLLSHALG